MNEKLEAIIGSGTLEDTQEAVAVERRAHEKVRQVGGLNEASILGLMHDCCAKCNGFRLLEQGELRARFASRTIRCVTCRSSSGCS